MRQFRLNHGRENCLNIHLTLVPYIKAAARAQDEADPAQREGAPRDRHSAGHPHLPHRAAPEPARFAAKIALFCNVDVREVIEARDVPSIYQVPLQFRKEGLDDIICEKLGI